MDLDYFSKYWSNLYVKVTQPQDFVYSVKGIVKMSQHIKYENPIKSVWKAGQTSRSR